MKKRTKKLLSVLSPAVAAVLTFDQLIRGTLRHIGVGAWRVEIICIQGSAPGRIVATLAHGSAIRQLPMMVARHASGGWQVLQADGSFGPRCHAVATAVVLEAGEAFADQSMDAMAA